ncbi:glycerophosphodiester phosphodiesterase [Ornithinibacillus halotolerans]|uniref:Glycerophosphoryl diester phosphodiesterase n=1 Tax=Ornithinibacillus halotolerans TaxID=1274357 RepID=A0A916WA58_9BACI|nr:glycerophosphodiester phosphodiesterase [Ornithinibacillus halotolerans]GGA79536.1 glycerophosphoryl diester phosphodiesterase [Ornithinibacillus halotolerans]
MTKIFGHRGSAGTHPENTMEAYQEAIRVGADGLEIDVHLTKDGKIAVFHDETVDRVTDGRGHVKDFTMDELKKLDAGNHLSEEFKGAKIPELKEVLALVKEANILINIELKNVFYLEYPHLEEMVLKEVERFNLKKQTIISSFNHLSMRHMRALDSEIDIAILYSAKLIEPWNYAETVGATSLHPHLYSMTEEMIRYSEAHHIPVRPYTVNDEKLMEYFFQLGCEAIITDYPERAITIRSRWEEERSNYV